jgi:hypothetical protein
VRWLSCGDNATRTRPEIPTRAEARSRRRRRSASAVSPYVVSRDELAQVPAFVWADPD